MSSIQNPTQSLSSEQTQRNIQILRELDLQRSRMAGTSTTTLPPNESLVSSIPPSPAAPLLPTPRPKVVQQFHLQSSGPFIPPMPGPYDQQQQQQQYSIMMQQQQQQQQSLDYQMLASSPFSIMTKERLSDVQQHGLGTYTLIENYGLIPILPYF
ncbi:unnamed protein product [Didymodactylos carnosus]|uniref:Uncharacterized protein n=1 Tax=Didymodactylos carnosus TaxID=1234261 RepID=A0A814QIN0_9BILA|nr:unnamed protein product [Didymodactylos carnosus]CAF1551345.1 unnamed protein product [Didymodactylos carnosus]CAF3883594.1 unnamed protein product [Didymodactylos carnosus]CAF4341591.1 unnamed protein product [Didymodactylos carnosus]